LSSWITSGLPTIKFCRALADRGVNIVAFQSFLEEKGKGTVRLVTDNPTMTKTVLESEHATHTETQIAQTKLPHRPGALASAAAKLGEAKININYAYPGIVGDDDDWEAKNQTQCQGELLSLIVATRVIFH
jgi:hypothetical protein